MNKEIHFRKIKEIPTHFPSFVEFLHFSKGDNHFNNNNFDFIVSIQTKIKVVELCLREFLNHLPSYKKENEILKERGYVEGIQYYLLIIKYETYLNSIYNLLENLARIVSFFYPKHSLPKHFNKQKKRFLNDRNIDPIYSDILDSLDWYDEIRSMRTEFTHFLSGTVVSFKSDIPGYLNKQKSERKHKNEKIEIEDIISHSKDIYKNLSIYLEILGKHLLSFIDKDIRVSEICGITTTGRMCVKMISYNEKKKGLPGICQTFKFPCPRSHECTARKT